MFPLLLIGGGALLLVRAKRKRDAAAGVSPGRVVEDISYAGDPGGVPGAGEPPPTFFDLPPATTIDEYLRGVSAYPQSTVTLTPEGQIPGRDICVGAARLSADAFVR